MSAVPATTPTLTPPGGPPPSRGVRYLSRQWGIISGHKRLASIDRHMRFVHDLELAHWNRIEFCPIVAEVAVPGRTHPRPRSARPSSGHRVPALFLDDG